MRSTPKKIFSSHILPGYFQTRTDAIDQVGTASLYIFPDGIIPVVETQLAFYKLDLQGMAFHQKNQIISRNTFNIDNQKNIVLFMTDLSHCEDDICHNYVLFGVPFPADQID